MYDYNSTICQILVDTHTPRERETETVVDREIKQLLKVKEGSNEIGAA